MFKCFFPTYTEKSVYKMDFDSYVAKGYKGFIFDIDNTLVGHDAPADERAESLLKGLKKKGYGVCLLSNNKGPRVHEFNKNINATTICDALKPKGDGYIRAVNALGFDKKEILAIGDQLFTDIWGANRAQIDVVLVERLFPKETRFIYFKRVLERIVLLFYKK